ncbi:hypothetical protein ABFS82_07G012800 [Erythranthe guttata]
MAESHSAKSDNPRKVRIVGKVRGLTDEESETLSHDSNPWISVQTAPGKGVSEISTVFLDSRRDGYELDYCYQQHEEINQIYSREIKPLILEIFDGLSISVIALGARGSGKTYSIQGCREKPGLAVIAMSEILSKAKELGKSVSISLYELTQEHLKDLLNPDNHAIQILEDAQGKVNLKGLSQVPVSSITEFYNIYFGQTSSRCTQLKPTDLPHSKGLIVHLPSEDDKLKSKSGNKINFVDLAAYEDPRNSCGSFENNNLLYALLDVVRAINSNETWVPYRGSKLTRILQDPPGGRSQVLLLTCLNPYFCQDSLSLMGLIYRCSSQGIKKVLTDSTNRSQNRKIMSASLSGKKQVTRSRLLSTNKTSCILEGRELFVEAKSVNAKQNQVETHFEADSSSSTVNMPEDIQHSSARFATPTSCCRSVIKQSFEQKYLDFLNSANNEELRSLKGIGPKRAQRILECRKKSPEPFKTLEDLKGIGVSVKQAKDLMKDFLD